MLQEGVNIQNEEMDAVAEFVNAHMAAAAATAALQPGAEAGSLPSDRRCDPVRSALAMAVARDAAGLACPGGGADGEAVDAFMAEVLLPSVEEDAATKAAATEVLRLFPEVGGLGGDGEGQKVGGEGEEKGMEEGGSVVKIEADV